MLVLPYPASPTNGQTLDATPVLANIQAITQAIQSFDASQVQAGTLAAAAFNANINPNTLLNETTFQFVQTGLVWSTVSGLNGTMSGGVVYINGIRVPVNSVASNTFGASKDTYVYVDVNGNITYSAVTNNTASPAAPANSVLIAIVVTGAAAISLYNQGAANTSGPTVAGNVLSVVDTNGVLIYPRDPSRRLLGYRGIGTSGISTASAVDVDITGLDKLTINAPAGRNVKFSGQLALENSNTAMLATYTIYDVTAGNAVVAIERMPTNNSGGWWVTAPIEITIMPPASGLRTYKMTIRREAGAGTITLGSATMFFKAELV